MTEVDTVLIQKLADDAKRHEREARESGDIQRAEYFRGLASGFICTIKVLED